MDCCSSASLPWSGAWVFANRVAGITEVGSHPCEAPARARRCARTWSSLTGIEGPCPHGIMRGGLELGEAGFYRFTDEQASRMRDRIGRHSNVMTRGLLKQRDEGDDR